MNLSTNKRDLCYTIISRFEESFRHFLAKHLSVLYQNYEEGIPQGIISKINEKGLAKFENAFEFLEETDFPDLKEISAYKGLYRYYFDSSVLLQEEFIKNMDLLYPVRCRIAHSKSIFTSMDIDDLINFTSEISGAMFDDSQGFIEFLSNLESDPEKHIKKVPFDFKSDYAGNIPNNIPVPDYESEGGFVGRIDDQRKIKKLVEGDLHRVITITGAGGVGKTAIAQQVVANIMLQDNIPFDGVIWTSAKENRLSAVGIEDIEPTIKNYEELIDTIIEVMGYQLENSLEQTLEQKEKDVETILELHDRILIIVDNLETITDDQIIDFILDAHPKLKILITSRRGLGQVERRYELNQLRENEAIALFRQLAIGKNLISLSRLSTDIIKNYVKKIACYPLAIKWSIGNVALGRDINEIIQIAINEKSDIAQFCFEQIYKSLSTTSKDLLCSLSMFDDPVTSGILKYVTNQNQIEFDEGIRELVLVSLIIQTQEDNPEGSIITKFNLLSLTRGFVREQIDNNPVSKKAIVDRIQSIEATVQEAEIAKRHYRHSLSNFGASTEEEKVAALLGNTAFQKYQMGRYDEAIEHYKRATEIAPKLASIYRNWAVMEANENHPVEANRLMEKASRLDPQDPQIWHIWGNMQRKQNKGKDALTCYEKALEITPDDHVLLNALGQAKNRIGLYEEADLLFRKALINEADYPVNNLDRHKIINLTSIADNCIRWSEVLIKNSKIEEGYDKIVEALKYCQQALHINRNDNKTKDLWRKILYQRALFFKKSGDKENTVKDLQKIMVSTPRRWQEIKFNSLATKELTIIYLYEHDFKNAKNLLSANNIRTLKKYNSSFCNDILNMVNSVEQSETLHGIVLLTFPDKGYTIIENTEKQGNTYLGHVSSFGPFSGEIKQSYKDKRVTFIPRKDNASGKMEATFIRFSE